MVAAVCGAWLLRAPQLERDYVYVAQDALIEDLMRDIHVAQTSPEVVEYYIAEIIIADYICYEIEAAVYEPEPVPAPVYESLPDNAFPNAIIGIGILTIESIELRLPVAEGVEYATLRIAPGRVPQTAQIGEIGNAVIAGHRNYTFGSMFNRLGEVEIGDIVQYQARNGEKMAFEVFEIAVIEPHDQIAFIQPVNESIITLYTCTPVRVASHRLIIRAHRKERF